MPSVAEVKLEQQRARREAFVENFPLNSPEHSKRQKEELGHRHKRDAGQVGVENAAHRDRLAGG